VQSFWFWGCVNGHYFVVLGKFAVGVGDKAMATSVWRYVGC
jgi:hypothetical protein